eukprot:gnl/TRDRNA2_/TRDRNA2_80472_c0_seq1.p1 gnl/TRDRNA2_/TRDRNA2_80472_c0~~gnl/TRDRNA2_/TRDRNA2_80472_c0_seq1.p1  ORF type:complete len:548 (-),score=22.01 gnl/TRDRNA2_/TRDRNA2_80472_c0_seq1:8-1651(-)
MPAKRLPLCPAVCYVAWFASVRPVAEGSRFGAMKLNGVLRGGTERGRGDTDWQLLADRARLDSWQLLGAAGPAGGDDESAKVLPDPEVHIRGPRQGVTYFPVPSFGCDSEPDCATKSRQKDEAFCKKYPTSPNCEARVACPPGGCGSNGKCSSTGECKCMHGFSGATCQNRIPATFEIPPPRPTVIVPLNFYGPGPGPGPIPAPALGTPYPFMWSPAPAPMPFPAWGPMPLPFPVPAPSPCPFGGPGPCPMPAPAPSPCPFGGPGPCPAPAPSPAPCPFTGGPGPCPAPAPGPAPCPATGGPGPCPAPAPGPAPCPATGGPGPCPAPAPAPMSCQFGPGSEAHTAQIAHLERAKAAAVAVENYELASQLKAQLDYLAGAPYPGPCPIPAPAPAPCEFAAGSAGHAAKIASLEQAIAAAVAAENYALAAQLKLELDYFEAGAPYPGPCPVPAPAPQPCVFSPGSQAHAEQVAALEKAIAEAVAAKNYALAGQLYGELDYLEASPWPGPCPLPAPAPAPVPVPSPGPRPCVNNPDATCQCAPQPCMCWC